MADFTFGNAVLDAYNSNLLWAHKMDDASSPLLDSTGNGIDASVSGTLTYQYTPSKNNYAIYNNNSARANLGNLNGYFPSLEFTYACWFLPYFNSKYYMGDFFTFFRCGNFTINFNGYWGSVFEVYDGSSFYYGDSPINLFDSAYHLLWVARDASGWLSVYIDNQAMLYPYHEQPLTDSLNTTGYYWYSGYSNSANGAQDEVWMWDTTLDSTARANLYNGGTGRFIIPLVGSELSLSKKNYTIKESGINA